MSQTQTNTPRLTRKLGTKSLPLPETRRRRRMSFTDRVLADHDASRGRRERSSFRVGGRNPTHRRRAFSLRIINDNNEKKKPTVAHQKSASMSSQPGQRRLLPSRPTVCRGPSVLMMNDDDETDDREFSSSCAEPEEELIGNSCVVVDHGSFSIKAGFAGRNCPSHILRTVTGCLPNDDETILVGEQALKSRVSLTHPIERGVITDWNAMEYLWEHLFENEMELDLEEHSVLCTEAPLTAIRDRERLVQTMFERFEIPRVGVAVQSMLSMLAARKTTAVVVDLGFGSSSIVPCVEGEAVPLCGRKLNVGGMDLSRELHKSLFENRMVTRDGLEHGRNFVRHIKETLGHVAPFEKTTLSCDDDDSSVRYVLPDGNKISIEPSKLHEFSEMLFSPRRFGVDHDGIGRAVVDCVSRCDPSLRRELLENVVVCGGTSLLPGLAQRMKFEVGRLNLQSDLVVELKENRDLFSWIGGSILATVDGMTDMNCFASMDEYDEDGPSVVHRKFCG